MKARTTELKPTEIKRTVKEPNLDTFDRLIEMQEEMEKSIDNAKTVKSQQEKLVEILEREAPEEFEDFIKGTKATIESMDDQIFRLSGRADQLYGVIEAAKDDVEVRLVIEDLVEALGLFR